MKNAPAAVDTSKKKNLFETGFENEKKDSSSALPAQSCCRTLPAPEAKHGPPSVLRTAKNYEYNLKFFVDNVAGVFNNDVLVTRYQPYTRRITRGAEQRRWFQCPA